MQPFQFRLRPRKRDVDPSECLGADVKAITACWTALPYSAIPWAFSKRGPTGRVTKRPTASPRATPPHRTTPHATTRHITTRRNTAPNRTTRHITSHHYTTPHVTTSRENYNGKATSLQTQHILGAVVRDRPED